MVLTIAFAVAVGILIARTFKDGLLAVIGLAIGFSIIEAFFNPTLALILIALAVLAFVIYVTSKADWKGAFTPQSHEAARSSDVEFSRSHPAAEADRSDQVWARIDQLDQPKKSHRLTLVELQQSE